MANESNSLYAGKQIRDGALLLLTGAALYLCWLLAKPFLAAITWALALAVVAYPLHRRFERWLRPNLAALCSLLAVAVVFLAPGAFLLQKLFDEAGGLIGENLTSLQFQEMAKRYPFLATALHWLQARFDLNQELKHAAGALASQASAVLGGSVRVVTQITIMLVTLFYFLRDRSSLLQFLRQLIPLSTGETQELFERISATINATLYGNLVVKLIQGILGGLMFLILGLPAPVFFGLMMTLLAMLPVVGTSFVWGPAAIVLLLQGSWIKATVLIVWGAFVVGLIDNFLYPVLVAGELRFHTLGVLFSVFGGLIAFGLAGVVLGPVILASTVALLEVWRLRAENGSERAA
jgi:predicted PurR-regulated permease PerM